MFPQISADASRATECEVIVVVGHKADLASAFDSELASARGRPQQGRPKRRAWSLEAW